MLESIHIGESFETMSLLVASVLALLVGPAIYSLVRKRDIMLSLLDGFIFVAITGLVALLILPDSFAMGGWLTLPFALIGLFGPTILEGFSRRSAKRTHIAALVLGLIGIGLHAVLDGTALSDHIHPAGEASASLLPFAVILHRFPVGLTVWWLLRPGFGVRTAGAVLALIGGSTILGFWFGPLLTEGASSQGIAWFQALVAGSLLHVVFHQPHLGGESCGCSQTAPKNNSYEGLGALLGIGLLAALMGHGPGLHHNETISQSTITFWALARESAPALLIAYLMAGLMNGFLPHSSISWMRRGSDWTQSMKGMAVGLPFPICSCGVVPLYQTLIRKGAPATAGMAFLIATPELGLDAVLLSIPLLGIEMTIVRVLAAALVALLIGRIVGGLKALKTSAANGATQDETLKPVKVKSFGARLGSSLKVGFGEVVDHTAPWILLGLAVAAVAEPFLSSGWLGTIPSSLQVPLFALLGLPVYVCASGATPFVAVLLFAGVSPGAALAFLLTGPATNVTTFGVLAKLHGKSIAVTFSLTIIALSVGLGYLVDALIPGVGDSPVAGIVDSEGSWIETLSLIGLSVVYLGSILRRGARRFVAELLFKNQGAIDLHPHYH